MTTANPNTTSERIVIVLPESGSTLRNPSVTVRDRGSRLCAITTFSVDGVPDEEVRARLRTRGINVSVATLDSAQLDLSHRGLESVVRASVHYTTTEDELDRFVDELRSACAPAS